MIFRTAWRRPWAAAVFAIAASAALAARSGTTARPAAATPVDEAARALSSRLVAGAGARKLTVAVEDFTVGDTGFGGATARRLRDAVERELMRSRGFRVVRYASLRKAGGKGYVVKGRIAAGLAEAWLCRAGAAGPGGGTPEIRASVRANLAGIRRERGIDVEGAAAPGKDAPPDPALTAVADRHEGVSELRLEMWTDRGESATFVEGESVVIHVRASRDCTLRILHVGASGAVQPEFPPDFVSPDAGRIRGGEIVTIPDPWSREKKEAAPPGHSAYKALATTGTLGEDLSLPAGKGPEAVAGALRSIRGAMLDAAPAAEASSGLETAPAYAEAAVAVTTVPAPAARPRTSRVK